MLYIAAYLAIALIVFGRILKHKGSADPKTLRYAAFWGLCWGMIVLFGIGMLWLALTRVEIS